jgi:hypothetical protein
LLASREGGGNLVVMSGSPTLILSLSKDEMS